MHVSAWRWPPCMAVAIVWLWSGFGPTTLSQTKRAQEVVRIRTSKPSRLRKWLPIVHRANFIVEILLAKNCRTYEIWGLKIDLEAIS